MRPTYGLFRAGIVPVLVDPGLGVRRLGTCLAEAKPEAFIGIAKAHVARLALGWGGDTVRHLVSVGTRLAFGGLTLEQLKQLGARSGHGEPPRGRLGGPRRHSLHQREHRRAQGRGVRPPSLRQPGGAAAHHVRHSAGEVDVPTFPLFGLFDPTMGMTAVLPDMDATKPASVNPHASSTRRSSSARPTCLAPRRCSTP